MGRSNLRCGVVYRHRLLGREFRVLDTYTNPHVYPNDKLYCAKRRHRRKRADHDYCRRDRLYQLHSRRGRGVSDATTYVSSTQVTALVPSSQLAAAGTAPIVASNGGTSVSTDSTSLQIDNPVPAISQISPAMLMVAAATGTVTVNGTGFVAATIVQVDGSSRPTTFLSGTQLTALLTAVDLAAAGTHSITAVNAAPGGGRQRRPPFR